MPAGNLRRSDTNQGPYASPTRDSRINGPDVLPRQGPQGALHPPPPYSMQAHGSRPPARGTRHLDLLFPQTSNSEESRHLVALHRQYNTDNGFPTEDLHHSMYHRAPRSGESPDTPATGGRWPGNATSPGRITSPRTPRGGPAPPRTSGRQLRRLGFDNPNAMEDIPPPPPGAPPLRPGASARPHAPKPTPATSRQDTSRCTP